MDRSQAADPAFATPSAGVPDPAQACGGTVVELEALRPNLYFLLDTSGSMSEPLGPAGVSGSGSRYEALVQSVADVLGRVGERVNYGAGMFPGGQDDCGGFRELLALGAHENATSGNGSSVLSRLILALQAVEPKGATPTTEALQDVRARLGQRSSVTRVILITDGAPNCNASLSCDGASCVPNLEGALWERDDPCDGDTNCCDAAHFGAWACLDDAASVAATAELTSAGIATLVVGIPGSEPFADVLHAMALAGGAPAPLERAYYAVSDSQALGDTLNELGLTIALNCTLELADPPPDPDLVTVYLDSSALAEGNADGWRWEGAQSLALQGSACARFQAGQVDEVRVVAGCPVDLH